MIKPCDTEDLSQKWIHHEATNRIYSYSKHHMANTARGIDLCWSTNCQRSYRCVMKLKYCNSKGVLRLKKSTKKN